MKLHILCACGVYLFVLGMCVVTDAAKAASERNTEVSAATNSVLSSPTLPNSGHFEDSTKVSNFDLATESPVCPSGLHTDQRKWRTATMEFDIIFNFTNIACSRGEKCPSEANISHESEMGTLSHDVELQYGDNINILTRIDVGNESIAGQINVVKIPEKESNGCDGKQLPVILSNNDTQNITLEKNILSPGTYVLSVSLFLHDVDCILSWKLKMDVRMHQCSKSKDSGLCSGTGICAEDKFDSFSCVCCPGFIGKYCEEKDGCYSHPCQHGGFCVDITEGLSGSTFQCLCPHGYKGRSCGSEVNLCDRRPCLNNGICQGNRTSYRCHCAQGFSGPNCGLNLNECLSNPCIHGVCEDGIGTYKCYCLPGYGGDHCEFEYDECDSSPCINGGACEDLVAGYRCHCGPGYRGRRCQIKVELCKPNPCQPPSQCVDRGNNYSCVCHPGFNGPGCTHHYDPCYPNPCQNGGSCWPNLDSFFCSCDQEHSGDLCEVKVRPPQRYVADYPGGTDKGLVTSNPVTVSLDHLHSMYAAAATLVGSCVVVILVVTICHCRIHRTYQHFTRMFNRSGSEVERQKLEDPGKVSLNLRGNASDAQSSMEPSFEACSIDLMDNLDIPLIK